MRGKGNRGAGASAEVKKESPTPAPEATTNEAPEKPDKQEPPTVTEASAVAEEAKEEGEIIERPLNDILRGRNPIMFCNDQSKFRNLHMEWEQVSETGPPHDKTFTWSLKMGDMQTLGAANSKKAAKNKAAEEMAKKIDLLPKPNMKRHFNQAFGGGFPFMMRGAPRGGRGGGRGGFYGNVPPPQGFFQPGAAKKTKKPEEDAAPESKPDDPLHPAQNNPISKLYEYTKKRKLPEPIFEVIQEEVLETRKTSQGFTYKKTKFTIQCEIMGKKYFGDSMNKKTAKFNSAAAAWADVGAGVGQASIDSLLQSGRQAAEAAAAASTASS